MPGTEPFVVLYWESDPGYVQPFRLSPRQLRIGPHYARPANFAIPAESPDIVVPPGTYDLDATMREAGIAE